MSYIGQAPANKPVSGSDLDATVITGQTALSTAPADTDEFLISDAGVLKRLDASLIGGTNTPSFFATNSSDQTFAHDTATKISFQTERFDTDSSYDASTNYRFTVPSGKAGKYVISYNLNLHQTNANEQRGLETYIYKNGSSLIRNYAFYGQDTDTRFKLISNGASSILDLSVGDYIEIYAQHNNQSGNSAVIRDFDDGTFFCGFKLI